MKEIKVKIREFGLLKDVELTFAPFMVFTGESNMGKSYANYLMYYLMSSILNLRGLNYWKNVFESEPDDKLRFSLSVEDIESWLHNSVEAFMQNFLGDENLKCDVDFEIEIDKRHEYFVEFTKNEQEVESKDILNNKAGVDYIVNINGLHSINDNTTNVKWSAALYLMYALNMTLFGGTFLRAIILPPGRGALIGENYTLKSGISSSVGMYRYFLNDYDFCVQPQDGKLNDNKENYNKVLADVIGGRLISEKDKQYLVMDDDRRLSLTAAASSIKEISPLLFFMNNGADDKYSFCFEEPEAHLHPGMQMKIADLIASYFNKGMMFQMTTHSDYFLTRINQLIKLGVLKKRDEERFNELCDSRGLNKSVYLDKEKIKAYYFYKDKGKVTVKDLDITEDGMPMATFFDTIKDLSERDEIINQALINEKGC